MIEINKFLPESKPTQFGRAPPRDQQSPPVKE